MSTKPNMLLLVMALGLMAVLASPVQAQLANAWMIPAAAHAGGSNSTFWYTDVSLHNPHEYDLPVLVQALPSNTTNFHVTTLHVTLYPYETLNLWDVFGDDLFQVWGTGALLVYYDLDTGPACDPVESCDFLATSRTYTTWGDGEFGQTIPGLNLMQGIDWWTFGYAAGVMNDDTWFRTNIGVASWTASWITVKADVQDADGNIIGTQELRVPPFGHVQRRLAYEVTGGSVVFYITAGPDDALVFPYSSVVNQETGDPSFYAAQPSVVGVSVTKDRNAKARPAVAAARTPSFPAVAKEIPFDDSQRAAKRSAR